MKSTIKAVFFLIFATSSTAFSEPSQTAVVTIENYEFELEQIRTGKVLVDSGEEEGISYRSVELNYILKQDNIVETPTLLASLSKAAADKCKEVAGAEHEGKIISNTRSISPWRVTGKFICSLK